MRRLLPVLFLAVAACGRTPARSEVVVFAAASLRDALAELEPLAAERVGAELVFSFGSSGDLARQIRAARPADVFFSAGEEELDRVAADALVDTASRTSLLSNQLVVVEPADGPSAFTQPFRPEELAVPALGLVSLAQPDTVPAGRYAREWLTRCGVWEALAGRVLPAVDVRAALAAVESGSVRAGIVYRTDAARSRRVRIVHAVPPAQGPAIVYPVAALLGRDALEESRALVAFLGSAEALAVFERHGFVPLERAQ